MYYLLRAPLGYVLYLEESFTTGYHLALTTDCTLAYSESYVAFRDYDALPPWVQEAAATLNTVPHNTPVEGVGFRPQGGWEYYVLIVKGGATCICTD